MTAPDDMNTNPTGTAGPAQSATPPLPADALPPDALIVLPMRNFVLFPEMVFPLAMMRPATVAAAQQAVREQRQVLIVLQRDPEKSEVVPEDLHQIGTVANIVRYVTAPDGTHHVICQGVQRFRITDFVEGHPFLLARGLHVVEPSATGPEIEARFLVLQGQVREVMDLLPQVPPELRQTIEATGSAGALADLAATYLDSKPAEKQEILEAVELVPRLDKVTALLAQRLEVLRLSNQIGQSTKASLDAR
ncbi:MAG: LON peptidase substrate-binding domain-containing protein, partial [Reyranella sp.]|nr:LON peptidase substrate-binding domain-containing protein [Reyranella sp.]